MVVNSEKAVEEKGVTGYGDGVAWRRGSMIGKGGFGCVYLATLKNPKSKYSFFPPLMAVKSAEVSISGSIQKEREVLSNVKGCSDIIRCFGEETTTSENGVMVYNLLLEYGSGGTLADRIKKSDGKGLPEIEARVYARSILRGLRHIHGIGYVHCDLKPDNILLVPLRGRSLEFRAKIADFGLAKRGKQSKKRKLETYWRGTPMYLSPESVIDSVQEAPSDLWAFGCIVLEMLTGKSPWEGGEELNADEILRKIGVGHELPKIPDGISKGAKDFLKGCFVRNPLYRLTAEMLLHNPFVEELGIDEDDEIEELEEVEDLDEVETIVLINGSNDELLIADEWDVVSEDESCYWTEEDEDIVEEFDKEGEFEVPEIGGATGSGAQSGLDQSVDKSTQIPSQVSSEIRKNYPVSCFTISAGV